MTRSLAFLRLNAELGDPRTIAMRIEGLMTTAESLHFNTDGLFDYLSFDEVIAHGKLGVGHGNFTNWEFLRAVTDYADKTTFYSDGIPVTVDDLRTRHR